MLGLSAWNRERTELIPADGAVADLAGIVTAPARDGAVGAYRAGMIEAPAFHRAIGQQRASVKSPGSDGDRVGQAADAHWNRSRGRWVCSAPVAELTRVVA